MSIFQYLELKEEEHNLVDKNSLRAVFLRCRLLSLERLMGWMFIYDFVLNLSNRND